jgi:protease secretion system membrane fusion protein
MALFSKWRERRARDAQEPGAGSIDERELRLVTEDMNNPGRPTRWGMWLLLLGFGGFIVWALVAPLDEGVPAPGTVMIETRRQTVQHLTGGIVREILVREAQKVKAGEVVMRLDDTTAKANYQAARQQYFALRAQEARLEAEQKGAAQIVFHADLLAAKNDPVAAEHMNLQRQLFVTRRNALQGEQAVLSQSLTSTAEAVKGVKAQLEGKQAQLRLVTEQLEGTRALAKDGYLPRNRWYEEERLAADLAASIGDLTATIARAQSSLVEIELRIAQRRREFMRDVETQLAETTRDAQTAAERWRATREDLVRTEIRSPAEGFVVGLTAHTVGGVVAPGARIMDVVPEGAPLTLDVRIEPHLIDRIRADLPADIRISAFVDNPLLVIQGRVISVSADLVTPEQPNVPPYYLGRVVVTQAGMKDLHGRNLQPGMPVEVVIKTGERTLMQYLLHPLIRRISTGFREA